MKLGFNSVLFGNFDPEKAFIAASEIGYSGIELSAPSTSCTNRLFNVFPKPLFDVIIFVETI